MTDLCQRHIYAEPHEQFPLSECPACIEEGEAELEIAMEFVIDERGQ